MRGDGLPPTGLLLHPATSIMIPIYKIVLGPILFFQGRTVRRTALRLPEAAGSRIGMTGSSNVQGATIRVLFIGDSSAAGVGVDHQNQALAYQTATFLADKLRAPVEWQLVAKSGVNTLETLHLMSEHKIKPADIVVTALGVNDVTSQRSPRQFLSDYQALVECVRQMVGARAIVINGVPPLHILPSLPQPLRWYLGQCAKRLDHTLRNWVKTSDQTSYVSLQWAAKPKELARDGYHPGADQYKKWAELVAESAAQLLRLHVIRA
jgi:lysophospholipase L1-like esterase